MNTLVAIIRLKITELALTTHTRWCQLRRTTTPPRLYYRLNTAVDNADRNPHLPDHYRDPRDINRRP